MPSLWVTVWLMVIDRASLSMLSGMPRTLIVWGVFQSLRGMLISSLWVYTVLLSGPSNSIAPDSLVATVTLTREAGRLL